MFTLDDVVPWGRSFDEYRRMFSLTDEDLERRIVGCGDGPASFNAEATRRGATVVSCDPIYRYSASEIRRRIDDVYPTVMEQARQNAGDFVWTTIHSLEELGRVRMSAMTEFLDDFPTGLAERRYVDAELPALPFDDASFDLALCSHLLFLYTTQLGGEFHRAAVREMCRVAGEVRVFPLLMLGGGQSPLVDPLVDALAAGGFRVSIENVAYAFQRGGGQMLRVRRSAE